MILDVPSQRPWAIVPLALERTILVFGWWSGPSMAMHTTANASYIGTQCIFLERDILKAKAANIYFLLPMILLAVLDMPVPSIGTNLLRNTSHFGIKTDMLPLVCVIHFCLSLQCWLAFTTGNFLRNHYREVLKVVHNLTAELAAIKHELQLTDDDFVQFLNEEQKYLDDLKQPPVEDRIHICYVETLDELAERRWTNVIEFMVISNMKRFKGWLGFGSSTSQ